MLKQQVFFTFKPQFETAHINFLFIIKPKGLVFHKIYNKCNNPTEIFNSRPKHKIFLTHG